MQARVLTLSSLCRARFGLAVTAVAVACVAAFAGPALAAPDDGVFVAAGGNDSATGTKANPFATLQKGVDVAKASGKDVYASGGTFSGFVMPTDADGVAVYGGHAPGSWVVSPGETTTVNGSPQAVLLNGATGVTLNRLTLSGSPDASRSAYGVRAINGSSLVLEQVNSTAAAAADGAVGGVGATGTPGSPGNNGGGACAQGLTKFGAGGFGGAGGAGGNNAAGSNGSTGGTIGIALGGTGGGLLGTIFGVGNNGSTGSNGASGPNNTPSAPDASSWAAPFAASGSNGGGGGGGGGGRGGTGDNNFGIGICGGGGGSGGTGGGGGGAGSGGQNGGGSFGAYILNSSIVAVASSITGADGGDGGNGGSGGFGGGGGFRGAGGAGDCLTVFVQVCGLNGANGGNGGNGGRGGGGGGGAGGPSYGVYQAGPTSGFVARDGTTTGSGTAGQGGLQGNGGPRAASGDAAGHKRTATAPETSLADFDGDGVNDSADQCPGTPGTVSGCPPSGDGGGGTGGGSGTGGGGGTGGGTIITSDLTKPTWQLSVARAQRALVAKAIKFGVRPSENCVLAVTAKLRGVKLGTAKKTLAGGVKSNVAVKLPRKALAALRKALRARKTVSVTLAMKAVDTAGNAATSTRKVTVKR